MANKLVKFLWLAGLLAGCNFAALPQGDASPTIERIESTLVTDVPGTATLTIAAITPSPVIATQTATLTAGPPTLPPRPTETLGPYEHTIQQNETLGFILQVYDYPPFDPNVLAEVVRINDNISNVDALPGAGAVILIPRQTATATPEDFTPAPDLAEALGVGVEPTSPATGLNVDAPIVQHTVVEGQTIVDIAVTYNTTLEVLAVLNPDISFAGCNFEIQSGGPNCNPILQVGQVVQVPAATPTPTLSPTPSGSETPTPTPTYAAPVVVSPPEGAIVPPGVFRLEWVSSGVLSPDEVYLVQITDVTTGEVANNITRSTSLLLPEVMIPADGQTHTINWTVSVAKPDTDGIYQIISGAPALNSFQWQSR